MLIVTKEKGKYGVGLLLLAVFLNLFFIQLACSLPHVMQRLEPHAATDNHHKQDDHGHSHTHDNTASVPSDHHHDNESDASDECCLEQTQTPFFKSSQDTGSFSVIKGQASTLTRFTYAIYSCFLQSAFTAVSHAPPDDLPPKIPDIRIFLQSLILFDLR